MEAVNEAVRLAAAAAKLRQERVIAEVHAGTVTEVIFEGDFITTSDKQSKSFAPQQRHHRLLVAHALTAHGASPCPTPDTGTAR